jgi:ribosomal protein S18 acetylase RimI-like enzyme
VWRYGELVVLRRPASDRDRGFVEEAHVAALGPVALVGYGWTKERLRAQFRTEIDLACCVSIEDRHAYWYIDAFAIVPNYQRHGVGGIALRGVLADAGSRPVRLSVLKTNRARALYARLGFRVIAEDRLREQMEWRPTS